MFCTKCGAQLPEDAEFCTKCGTKLKGAASEQTVHGQAMPTQKAVNKNRNKIAKPLVIAALLLCVVGAFWYSKSDVRQNLLMDAGAKAVSEQNFAKALKCYQKLYKLDNQSEELYLFGADVYLAQDRWEDAIRIIEEGIALTGSERLKNRLGYICENVVVVSAIKTWEDGEVEFEFEYDKWGNLVNVYEKYSDEEFPVGIKLEHDNKGNLLRKVYYTDKNFNGIADDWEYEDSCEEFEYDNKGNVISWKSVHKYVSYDANGDVKDEDYYENWGEYEYDKHGNRIKDTEGHEDGISYVREYDSDGNEIKEVSYDDNGSINYSQEHEYDKNGNQIKYVVYDSDGSISHRYEYEYDSQGNIIKEISYDIDGNTGSWSEYEYDSHGNQVKMIRYDSDGRINYGFESEYDNRGNQIKYVAYDSDKNLRGWWEYEYDSRGNRIKYVNYDSDGSLIDWTECEYDNRGNQIKNLDYDSDGNLRNWWDYKYDNRGYEIKSVNYNEDGKVTSKSERELNAAGFSVKENDYYMWDTDGEETESFSEYTWEYQFTYAGDILCCCNITPLSGVIKFVQDIPAGSGYAGDYDDYGAFLIMKRKPSNQSPYSYAVYFEILNEGINKYYDVIQKNMLVDDDEAEWEVVGETAGYYQLANGWYVAKDQPEITFIEQ